MVEQEKPKNAGDYTLEVPLDAGAVDGLEPGHSLKVAAKTADGAIQSRIVKLDGSGKSAAKFTFAGPPGRVEVAVGPADATDDELYAIQTLRVDVPSRVWREPQWQLAPIRIQPYYWYWWLRWCREFVIRGRVLCPDGRPVPGAKVCAMDVDGWWWWSSVQNLGCATTDANGVFEIKFRWCCGWYPWWWWRTRIWRLDDYLLERILPVLQNDPRFGRIEAPTATPDLAMFANLVGEERFARLNLTRHLPAKTGLAGLGKSADALATDSLRIQPAILAELTSPLREVLPHVPELESLRLWPWWPWYPWWDCNPDVIFRVTQDCRESGTVILEEHIGQARWNVSPVSDVLLIANDKACCLGDVVDDPQGSCALITNVCDNPIHLIGGNPGALAAPLGYLSPGALSNYGDRPYADTVLIQGQVGSAVDYYEFQISDDGGVTWNDMAPTAVGGVQRQYWIPATNTFVPVPFLTPLDGRLVFESRQHYEATHSPASWNVTQFWMADDYFSLMRWLTKTPFENGTYRLRVLGWQLVGGHLANPQVLPICSTQTPADLVLRIDNRLEGAGSGHVIGDPNHPCGAGTVHTCTLEPDTDFLDVRIVRRNANGIPTGEVVSVGACGNVPVGPEDLLQVDFYAHDPEGHLAYYTMQATYRENLAINLLALPSLTLSPLASGPVAAATQVGPSYSQARSALPPPMGGAVAPYWRGGTIRLEVLAREAFPETCCYQLELRAHKRTVVGCDHSLWGHTNYSEYSFMIVV